MKKLTSKLLLPFLALTLSSCAFFEFKDNEKNMVDMGDGEKSIKWNLVENNNEYHPVQTAYFEVKQSTFKYYEDGTLKKEGSIKAVYHGLDHETRPLTIRLDFGYDDNHLDVYDEFMCYTEDEKENLHQFTIMAMGYHIKPLRNGGVPIRDYHLSEMPYAFGTFVKESTQRSTYQNKDQGKVTIATRLKGTFLDEAGNKFYCLNNRYFNKNGYYFTSSKTYFRYENNVKNIFLEGTIYLSYTEESGNKTAVLRVMHGDSEPAEERGVVIEPDYRLLDFDVTDEYVLSFSKGDYFFDRRECDWNPNDFIAGSYTRQTR